MMTLQHLFHTDQKFQHLKRLYNIILRPFFQSPDLTLDIRFRRQENHRNPCRLQLRQKRKAILSRKHDIHQSQIKIRLFFQSFLRLQPILKEAYDKGIEVAVANIKLNDASFVCGGFTSQDLLNGQKLGDYTAKYLSDKYGNDLKIAIMDFDAAIPEQSKARYGGFLEKLTANGVNYEIVAQQSFTSKNDNVPIVEAMLAGAPDCNVFFCTSAAFTNVVVQVVMNMGLSDKITVVGYDMGEQTATQLLDENSPLYCTLEQDMYTMGYKAVEQLVKTLRGEKTECPRGDTVYLEGIIHSKEDLAGVQTWLDGYYKLANS